MKRILIFILLAGFGSMLAQKSKVDSLKKLGRNALIKMAADKIKEPGFKPENYDRIVVKANAKSLLVSFGLSVTLLEKTSCYYSGIEVVLAGEGGARFSEGDCDKPKFHEFTTSRRRKIDFVFDAINKSEEVGHLPGKKMPEESSMTIREELLYYEVEVSDWSTMSRYKVSKASGKIYDATHKHYARSGEEKDEYEIIR